MGILVLTLPPGENVKSQGEGKQEAGRKPRAVTVSFSSTGRMWGAGKWLKKGGK